MSVKRFISYLWKPLLLTLLIHHIPYTVRAADEMENSVPPITCGAGWKLEGRPLFYDRETLSDRINGEAELYFPYGFDRMAAARYVSEKNSGSGMDVEIYRMGSPLDAFGMYANYRQSDGRKLDIGAESNLSSSQFFFYQGRYFVHIQVTGANAADPDALTDCARTVASRMPGSKNRPPELSVFDRPEVITGTERYLPQSLLGYDFLNRGIMADARIEGENFQVFVLLGTSLESASAAFGNYHSRLTQGKIEAGVKSASFLEGVDPLYGPVVILRRGVCLAGALRFNVKKGIRALLENVCR